MTILITGGAGFIGSCLAAALERAGRDVAICDDFGAGEKWRNVARRRLADVVAPADLPAWLDAHGSGLEAVLHMGAVSSTTERDVDLILEANYRLTLRLWSWCAERGVRLIYASSAATYGDGAAGFGDDSAPAALARLRPLNAYGWSKHLLDRKVVDLVGRGEPAPPQWAGLKFFNVYGPNEWHKGGQQSVVPQILGQIRQTGAARLFKSYRPDVADGEQKRDFVWIDDVTDVMIWLLDNPDVSGIFNVGSGRARSFVDLAHAVFAAMDRPPAVEFIDMPEGLRERYQYFTEAPLARLRAAGFRAPTTSLEEGVRRYVQESLLAEDPYR